MIEKGVKIFDEERKEMNIIKALGIIAVVLGHTAFPYGNVIYSYHMALFFFVSGYFFKDEYINKPILFIKKRLKGYYVPFVLYNVIFLLIRNIFVKLNIYDITMKIDYRNIPVYIKERIFLTSGEPLLGTFWFFIIILYVSVLFLIINIILNKFNLRNQINLGFIISLIYIIGFILWKNNFNIPIYLNPNNNNILRLVAYFFDYKVLILLQIYCAGYLYRLNKKKIKIRFQYTILIIGIMYYFKDNSLIEISSNIYSNPIYFYCASLGGIYVNLYLAKLICLRQSKLLTYIGENSMYIMIFHFLAFKVVNYIEILFYKLPIEEIGRFPTLFIENKRYWWIIFAIFGVLIPIVIKYIIEKIIIGISKLAQKKGFRPLINV